MANVNTDIVTNFVATPQVKNDSQQLHGVKRIAQGTIALAAGDLSASDTVMLAPVPTNASISSIKLFNDDLDSGTTMTTDVGLYSTAIAAVDDDAYASAITDLRGAVTTGTEVAFEHLRIQFLQRASDGIRTGRQSDPWIFPVAYNFCQRPAPFADTLWRERVHL